MSASQPTPDDPAVGQAYLWGGIALCLGALPLVFVQFALKALFVPWYSPVMATLGAGLILMSVARRPGIFRGVALVLIAAFAGLQWYFLGSMMKLPEYAGPARAGERLPAFAAVLADRSPFTEADLRDGSRRVMVFFRGRW